MSSLVIVNPPHNTTPYRVTTEEVKASLDWLQKEYEQQNIFAAGKRTEEKEIRFNVQDVPTIKDEDILRKFEEAKALAI